MYRVYVVQQLNVNFVLYFRCLMLKWTVGQGNKDGGGRSPSRIGPCYSIRRAAQKLSSRPNRRTKSFSDKENHAQCPSSVVGDLHIYATRI